ncbi:phage regulatory CII family protein [Silvimonas sp.]|uniref:phage regulatory CII family protein n=1 Tax=Silvimonas sp. TaxID=2650811 RepID=UPI00284F6445|nr:phage regulatory CII family protein [Silvimonas sp.]MDR3427960.1 hypothetical protein [Silvimonas sp.]
MSLNDAIREDCKVWRGTQESLSRDLFGSADGLRHKLIGYRGSRIQLEDAMSLMLLTGGRATINEMARELGGVFLQLPAIDAEFDNTELHAEIALVTVKLGELLGEVSISVANDGKIDAAEEKRIESRRHELFTQIMHYITLSLRVYGDKSTSLYRSVGNPVVAA